MRNMMKIRKLFGTAGEPFSIFLAGTGTIVKAIMSLSQEEISAPEHIDLRLAFMTLDWIRTGEIDPWECALCARSFSGLRQLACIAVIRRARGGPLTRDNPAITPAICHRCDSVSTYEMRRRIERTYGLSRMQE